MTKEGRIQQLNGAKTVLLNYLFLKVQESDWHGVQDAASDLRDIESEIKGLMHESR